MNKLAEKLNESLANAAVEAMTSVPAGRKQAVTMSKKSALKWRSRFGTGIISARRKKEEFTLTYIQTQIALGYRRREEFVQMGLLGGKHTNMTKGGKYKSMKAPKGWRVAG